MKVISKIDPKEWSKEYKCLECDSVLEIVADDLSVKKEVIGISDGGSCGIIPVGETDVFFFKCPVCEVECEVHIPFIIQKYLTEQLNK